METLADRIARNGPIKELDAVGWAIRLARRLEALHALGVAHGSVSPACVLTAGVERTAKATLVDVQRTQSMLGFQSPERVLGGDLSPADDTWAVAATLYTLLTGKRPFASANEGEVRQKILAAAPPPLAAYDVGDDDLQHILERVFSRDINARTTTMSALRHALEEWHPDPSVGALPPLDDEDATAEDDDDLGDAQTVMRINPAYIPRAALEDDDDNVRTLMREPPPPGAMAVAPPPRVAGAVGHDDDDDDDNARTVMRGPDAWSAQAPLPASASPRLAPLPASASPRLAPLTASASPRLAPQGLPLSPGPWRRDPLGESPVVIRADEPPAQPRPPAALAAPIVSPWAPNPVPGPIIGQSAPSRGLGRGTMVAALLAVLVAAAVTFVLLRYRILG